MHLPKIRRYSFHRKWFETSPDQIPSFFETGFFPTKPIHRIFLMNLPTFPASRHPLRPRGISLVELLVVITIIVVLAALSTIGISRVRSSARGATCTSNLRQIGTAMLGYATDNNGQLPPLEDRTKPGDGLNGIWPQIIADGGYLPRVTNSAGKLSCNAGVWACPDCTVVQLNYQGYGGAEGTVMKVMKSSVPGSGSVRLTAISKPARTWLVGDTANNAKDLKTGWYAIWANSKQWTNSHAPAPRHGGKVNVCMADGHVESLTMKELQAPEKDYTMFK
jgi:prepilin-type processing-associated H-X9-DG protein/prepilin-type N-terminal cleavage/methylation domain-containing protein